MAVQVGIVRVTLHSLGRQFPVGHRVAHHNHALPQLAQGGNDAAGRLTLAAAGAHSAHRHDRLRGGQHGRIRAEQPEVGPCRQDFRRTVHDVFVGHVAIGEDDAIDALLANQARQVALGVDGDAIGVERARQAGGVAPVGNTGDLGGGEGDHLVGGVGAENHVEIVEVATGRAHDEDSSLGHTGHSFVPKG